MSRELWCHKQPPRPVGGAACDARQHASWLGVGQRPHGGLVPVFRHLQDLNTLAAL